MSVEPLNDTMKEIIEVLRAEYADDSWIMAVVVSVSILVFSVLLYILVFRLVRRIVKRSLPKLDIRTYNAFKIPFFLFLLAVAMKIILASFIPEDAGEGYFNHFLTLLIIFSITWILGRSLRFGREVVMLGYDIGQKDNLKARRVYTQLRLIERILWFIIILVAVAISLMTFEGIRNVGISLFASAGVAGIIVGFSAQRLIATVIAGFQIAVSQPIRIDDVVIVENEWGRVEEINLTYVVINIWDKRRLILPTTYFIEKPFQNWSRTSADILGTVFLYTDYTVPFDELRKELTRILESDPNWDGEVNVLQVTNSTEKTVEIRALMSAQNSSAAWDLRVRVREELIGFLQKNYPECLPKTRLEMTSTG